jgi:hypothetical protein
MISSAAVTFARTWCPTLALDPSLDCQAGSSGPNVLERLLMGAMECVADRVRRDAVHSCGALAVRDVCGIASSLTEAVVPVLLEGVKYERRQLAAMTRAASFVTTRS